MAYKFNPFTSKLEEYGPILTGTGTVSAAADGTAALPGIAFTNDLNTGIYRPGADQLALSTNGTGRLFIDASGNVGVGAAPVVTFNGQTHLTVNHSTGGTTVAGINLATDGTRRASLITYPGNSEALRITAESTTLPITVHTNGSERLRITSAGLVGIGTSAPGTALDVTGSTRSTASAYNPFSGTNWNTSASFISAGAYGGGHSFVDGSAGFTVYADSVGTRLNVAYGATGATPTTGLTFTNAGRLGIGSTSPAALLDVQGSAYIGKTDSTYGTRIIAGSGSYAQQEFYNGATRQLFIHSRGDISYSRIVSDNWLLDLATAAAQPILFTTNGNERARIDSSGRLLVGTASSISDHFGGSGTQLQIAGTSYQGSAAQLNAFGTDQFLSPHLVLNKARGTQASPLSVVNNDKLGGIVFTGYAASTPNQPAARIECFVDGDPETAGDTSDLPGRLVFSTTSDGQASPTPRLTITSTGQVRLAGAGITFNGDTATANELDDYEEGTFTPTVVGTTTAGTATYAAQIGRYTKIGNLVNFTVYLSWSGGTGSGDLKVNGLPFTINSESNRLFACSVAWVEGLSLTAGHVPQAALYNNETRINIQSYPTGGTSFANVAYDAGAAIAITGSYTV